MMNIDFINPLDKSSLQLIEEQCNARSLFFSTTFSYNEQTDLSNYNLVVVGVTDDRFKPRFLGCGKAPNLIRKYLYKLIKPRADIKILDLGNIYPGNGVNDTHFATTQILSQTIKNKIPCIIIGGSQDFMVSQYKAYEGLNHNVNALIVDAKADLHTSSEVMQTSYLPRIIANEPNFLFNISLVGYQSYFVEPETYDTFERLNFDMTRLGVLRSNMTEVEPLCRNAHYFAMSMASIKAADAPGQFEPSPNGFTGDEACRIARYAGMGSDILTAGFYDCNPTFDINFQTSHLTAQLIWHFIDGVCNRRSEYPVAESKDYMIYRATGKQITDEIVFYKSLLTNRWWMEVPYPNERSKSEGKYLVPCSYSDYETAQNDELPDRWLKAYQKLSS